VNEPQFRRSSRCSGGNCVEIAQDGDQFLIRDSKRPEIAPLSFTKDEWTAFVEGVTAGEFSFR
jgi:hypothetical protein